MITFERIKKTMKNTQSLFEFFAKSAIKTLFLSDTDVLQSEEYSQ